MQYKFAVHFWTLSISWDYAMVPILDGNTMIGSFVRLARVNIYFFNIREKLEEEGSLLGIGP